MKLSENKVRYWQVSKSHCDFKDKTMVTNNILIKEFPQVCFQGILRQKHSWPNYSNIVKFTPGLSQMLH